MKKIIIILLVIIIPISLFLIFNNKDNNSNIITSSINSFKEYFNIGNLTENKNEQFASYNKIVNEYFDFITPAGFTKIYEFNDINSSSILNFTAPDGNLIVYNNIIYGVAISGGFINSGTIFRINPDGSDFTKLHEFNGDDGAYPYGKLVVHNNTLYGMTVFGGKYGKGTIFKINPDGSGFAKLHDFNSINGSNPWGSLIVHNGALYGLTPSGGKNIYNEKIGDGCGTMFKINPDGTGFTKLYDFNDANHGGYVPYQSLVEYNNVFYGITKRGGDNYAGTIFRINLDGSGFAHIYNFDKFYVYNSVYDFNEFYPAYASNLFLYKNNLYGVINVIGIYDKDIIFKINPDGTGFTKLYNLSDQGLCLIEHDDVFYGITISNKKENQNQEERKYYGSIFKINPDGTGFTKLYNFYNDSDINISNVVDFIGGLAGHNNALYGVIKDDEVSITSMMFSFGL